MFYYLNGTVAELLPGMAVMDCGGVGYACRTTSNTLSALKRGQNGKLYTFLHVGDAIFDLYGFATRSELDAFRMLIGVSGVGPKAALGLLSAMTPDALTLAIRTCNSIDFTKPKIVHVLDTLHLDVIALSETYLDVVADIPEIEILSDPYELEFDDEGFLITNW